MRRRRCPENGWSRTRWRKGILRGQQVAGGLYALRGQFVERLRAKQVRIPKGTLCDDAIISLFAADNLGDYQGLPGSGIVPEKRAGLLPSTVPLQPETLGTLVPPSITDHLVPLPRDTFESLYPQAWIGRFA